MRRLRSGARRRNALDQPLDAIRIFTAELELHGYVASSGQRITDILLRGDDLAFLPAGADVVPENWMRVSPLDILVVIPPPLPAPARWMDAIELIGLFVQVGPTRSQVRPISAREMRPTSSFAAANPSCHSPERASAERATTTT